MELELGYRQVKAPQRGDGAPAPVGGATVPGKGHRETVAAAEAAGTRGMRVINGAEVRAKAAGVGEEMRCMC